MAYEKRVCVMKQVKKGFTADGSALSGVVYAERWGDRLKLTPRLLALAPVQDGRYVFVVQASGQKFCLEYEGDSLEITGAPSIQSGVCVLLCFVKGGAAEPVAFGCCGTERASAATLVAAVGEAAEKKKRRPANPLPPTQLPATSPNVPLAPTPIVPDPLPEEEEKPFRDRLAAAYDDEAIAAGDYYAYDGNEPSAPTHQTKKGKSAGDRNLNEDEAVPPEPAKRGTLTYYNTVREELKTAFEKYPSDNRFAGVFPQSEWVNAGEALLGIVYENGQPRYLCVAREEQFPKQTGAEGTFVPYTAFAESQGAYVVFQDADTGEYVKVYDA